MNKEKLKAILDFYKSGEIDDPFNPYVITKKTMVQILEAILEE